MDAGALARFLSRHPPFDSLSEAERAAVAAASTVQSYADGEVVLDAFADPAVEVCLVLTGRVRLLTDPDRPTDASDTVLGPGGVFGFSAVLTARSVGPRAVAMGRASVARVPGDVAAPAFSSPDGARFLAAETVPAAHRTPAPGYSLVDDLIVAPPLVVSAGDSLAEVARRMTAAGCGYAVVHEADGTAGMITDAVLRRRVLVDGVPPDSPAGSVLDPDVPTTHLGDSAVEAFLLLLDRDADHVLVTARDGTVRGVLSPRDFAVSPATAGVSLHERLRRAGSVEELTTAARGIPAVLGDLLDNGLASGRVIAVHSAMLDTVQRRAIEFVFGARPELPADAFTWLALGSNGRREAVPSSDADTAVAFVDDVPAAAGGHYRALFAEVHTVLAAAGLAGDGHGATAARPAFARTNAQWRAAAQDWLAAPHEHQGALLTSLMVDARPIHGDPGLPAVTRTIGDLRRHPGTMRLLLQESLARRARGRSVRHLLTRRTEPFDLKTHALQPLVTMARWSALAVGSHVLPTTERLRAATGSAMLPDAAARTLVEVFEALQRVRLRHQVAQVHAGHEPSDLLRMDRVSAIDRSVIAQAVREIAGVQRRMDNVAHYVPVEGWTTPDPSA